MADIPSTITEQIETIEKYDISYRTLHGSAILHNKEDDSNIKIPFSSMIEKYKDFLYEIIITSDATKEELAQYIFNPKKLSQDLYGTTEFWDTILILNDCKSIIDFDLDTIKVYDPNRFKRYLNEIIITDSEIGK